MAKLNWDVDGTRKFHAGVSHGVVYPKADGEGYDNGAAWNGLTGPAAQNLPTCGLTT